MEQLHSAGVCVPWLLCNNWMAPIGLVSELVAHERTVTTETAAPFLFSNVRDQETERDGHAGFRPLGDRNNGRNGSRNRSAPRIVGFSSGIQDPELVRLLRDRRNDAVPC